MKEKQDKIKNGINLDKAEFWRTIEIFHFI